MVPVASRASAEPTALVIVMIGQPLSRAALTAPMVSAVSPDWETATTSVSGPAMASRYRYSDARSASAGKPASRSTIVLPSIEAWYAVPQATNTTRWMARTVAGSMFRSGRTIAPATVRANQHRGVVRSAAGDEHDALDGPHRGRIDVQVGQDDRTGLRGDPASEGIGDGPRLLVDLLEHEVPVATLLGHDRIPHDSDRLALHRLIVERREHHAAGRDDGHPTVLEDHDVARLAQDRRDIGGDEHLALAEAHDHAPRAVLGGDETVGRSLGDDAHRVRALELGQRGLHRPLEAWRRLEVMLDQVSDDFGVGLRLERMALGLQPFLDLEVVFQDAVVDDDERTAAVGVGVGVVVGRPAVGGPPGVPDPDSAGERALAQDALKILDAPGRAPDLQRSRRREHGDTSRVIAAVLEALEALEDDADGALVSDVADDPTHSQSPFRVFDLRLAAQPSLTTWGLRSSASAPGGTSRVITDPAAT